MKLYYLCLTICIFFYSCIDKVKKQKKQFDQIIIEAYFDKNNRINGEAKYFDEKGVLISSIDYNNGVKNGVSKNFFSNGKIMDSVHFINGFQNGYHYGYDSSGNLVYKDFYYNDHALGPQFFYAQNSIDRFVFNSFERKELYSSVYDSVGKFSNSRGDILNVNTFPVDSNGVKKLGLFIYLPNPPGMNIKYGLGIINNINDSERKEVLQFDSSKIFIDTILSKNINGWSYFVYANLQLPHTNEKKYLINKIID
jgi:hypothetical protein